MAKLGGIIYRTFGGYAVLRGHVPIRELAEIPIFYSCNSLIRIDKRQ